jgi:hypothetical protein
MILVGILLITVLIATLLMVYRQSPAERWMYATVRPGHAGIDGAVYSGVGPRMNGTVFASHPLLGQHSECVAAAYNTPMETSTELDERLGLCAAMRE